LDKNLAEIFEIRVSEKLVVIRGSNIGPGFIARGPIHNLAMQHGELEVF
jgi:hypothetical protein